MAPSNVEGVRLRVNGGDPPGTERFAGRLDADVDSILRRSTPHRLVNPCREAATDLVEPELKWRSLGDAASAALNRIGGGP